MAAFEKRRPTTSGSGSFTVTRSWALACSLVGGVGDVGADQPDVVVGEARRPADELVHGAAHQGRLVLDVEAGEHERHGVAPSAEEVDRHLELLRRRAGPAPPTRRTRSAPTCSRWMVEKSATTSGLA